MRTFNVIFLSAILSWSTFAQENFTKADPNNIGLFPQQNDIRNTLNISGMWKFKKDSIEIGEKNNWQSGLKETRSIAVPGSWNEQFADSRDYLGMVWYEKETFVPSTWKGQKIFIRVGSANYATKLWLNGIAVGSHNGGHLPFAFDISSAIKWGESNRVTIQIENTLKPSRVPTGGAVSGGLFSSNPKANFDFFPFAGLNRDVWLYSVPPMLSIKDVTVNTTFQGTMGSLDLKLELQGKAAKGRATIKGNGKTIEVPLVISGTSAKATVAVPDVRLWSPEDPFLYTVEIYVNDGKTNSDHYTLETGIRTISTTNKQLLLNGKPIFLKGFGKHEDFPIYGRGTALPVIIKDYALLKWVGANSYRTSHYPYDEEYMRMADKEGILIIDEIPAVGLYFQGDTTERNQRQQTCIQYIDELIKRDKNHPSVIMWSVANEPFPPNINLSATGAKDVDPESVELFSQMIKRVKDQDQTRPVTIVGVMGGPVEWLALTDIICINRYWGWYTNPGDIKTGAAMLSQELDGLHKKLNKPIIITEFGADTYPGMHADQPEMFTEEYQRDFIKAYIDVANTKDYMAGMHVWAFADFKTGQGVIRFGGMNYKGVFTRDRKPKMAAHYLKSIWTKQ
jgi:beta-glucuronidase